ncbi:MAG: hypothetical protein J3R72DRAFT_418309 [Linnemannia gamsii]|nr:MAG: hypothetical protein J3R72DRAFT_418309 [Linnemannia gamsii]
MRQKALREEARREKAKQEAALREELAHQERLAQLEVERQRREQLGNRSSSRSLSPGALSGSSLSSDDDELSEDDEEEDEDDEGDDGDQANGDGSADAVVTDESSLRSNSAIALIYGFLTKFRPWLRQTCPLREVSIEDIESGLTATEPNTFIEEIHANLLSNMLNRKKAVDGATWQKVLSETLDGKLRTGELEYDQNPLRYYGDYYLIPTPDRAYILKALIDWVLQEGLIVRQGIDQNHDISRVEPFGFDQARRVYWHFGDGTLMMYRETKGAKKRKPVWETVASNLEELKTLANSFEKTVSKAEKALRERLHIGIIEPEEERVVNEKLKQERQEKKLLRMAELHELAATRTTRTRSSNRLNAPKYTFDDDEDDFEDDGYDLYRRPSSRRRIQQEGGAESNPGDLSHDPQVHHHHHHRQQSADHFTVDLSNGHGHYGQEPGGNADSASRRSSLGQESDSSIRAALQRTRMGDGRVGSASASVSASESIEREDQDGDYKFEEDRDDDDAFSAPSTSTAATALLAPKPEHASEPVAAAPVFVASLEDKAENAPLPVATVPVTTVPVVTVPVVAAPVTTAPVAPLPAAVAPVVTADPIHPAPTVLVASSMDQDVDMI